MTDIIIRECIGHSNTVNSVKYTKDGNYCMSCSDDKTVKLWNPSKDESIREIKSSSLPSALMIKNYKDLHNYPIYDIAIYSDNSRFLSGGLDRYCSLIDITTGQVLRKIITSNNIQQKNNALALNNDNTVLITASDDQTISLWDLRSSMKDPIQSLKDFKDAVTSISQTDDCIIGGSIDGTIKQYDIRAGLVYSDNFVEPITSMYLTYNKSSLLAMCLGGTVRLVELSTGTIIQEYLGSHNHTSYMSEVTMNNDNNQVICGSEDGYIVYYDFITGKFIKKTSCVSLETLNKTSNKQTIVTSLSMHPKESFLLAGLSNNKICCIRSS